MDFGNATDALMDESMWYDAAQVLAGLGASVVLKNGIDSRFDAPDEVYGLAVAGGSAAMGYPTVAVGGMGYTGVKAAERIGLKSTVEQAGM